MKTNYYPDAATAYNPFNPYGSSGPDGKSFPANKEDSTFPEISTTEIIQRLKLGRNFISKKISGDKTIEKHLAPANSRNGTELFFNGYDLRKWLMEHATFTRQTRRIHPNDFADCGADNLDELLGPIPVPSKKGVPQPLNTMVVPPVPLPVFSERQRKEIATINVAPFDFWDKKLYFPKEYYRENQPKPGTPALTAENCYRDMFLAGAIKIQLGRQKTMFYIPEKDDLPSISLLKDIPINDKELPLIPAAWHPFSGYDETLDIKNMENWQPIDQFVQDWQEEAEKQKPRYNFRAIISLQDDVHDSLEAIEAALKKGFIVDDVSVDPIEDDVFSVAYTVHLPATEDDVALCYVKSFIEEFEKNDPQSFNEQISDEMKTNLLNMLSAIKKKEITGVQFDEENKPIFRNIALGKISIEDARKLFAQKSFAAKK